MKSKSVARQHVFVVNWRMIGTTYVPPDNTSLVRAKKNLKSHDVLSKNKVFVIKQYYFYCFEKINKYSLLFHKYFRFI